MAARPAALPRCAPSRARPSPRCPAASVRCGASRGRRDALLAGAGAAAGLAVRPGGAALAVQGLTAGRLPGLSPPDSGGLQTYTRPEGKSGGHGIGWSEITPYSFQVPADLGWEEIPVSIADLSGTELDLRFRSEKQGDVAVVIAPVLRFADVGFNADVRIEELGGPKKMITAFAPELFGTPLEEDGIVEMSTEDVDGLTFYSYECKPHFLVKMTAYRNRLYILNCYAKSMQWRKSADDLRRIQQSFKVLNA